MTFAGAVGKRRLSVSAIVLGAGRCVASALLVSPMKEKTLDKTTKPRGNHGARVLPHEE